MWELRAALLEALPFACHMIGRASTQHFVLPCLKTSLGDAEERVIESALVCLAELLDLGLIARSALIGKLPGVDASERNENKSMRLLGTVTRRSAIPFHGVSRTERTSQKLDGTS
jgi:hypothetical protein